METIIILSRKGGVGKTATAHALGAALMKRKKRVLFIDADGQSNLTLTMKGSEDNLSLYDVLNHESTIKRAMQETEGGYIIPANEMLHAADITLKGTDKNLILREALKEVSKQFDYCIIDEAQNIKNPDSIITKAIKCINSDVKFALTGTPIENSLADLWSIFDFCLPGYLKSYEAFKYEYEVEIVRNHNQEALERLNHQIAPFILRRTKSDVLRELPAKFEQVIYAPMSEEQEKVYNATLMQARERILQTGVENKMYIFSMLTRLRQICCHPGLYVPTYQGDSSKLNLVNDIIFDSIGSNHRMLIFSQFTSMLEILDNMLTEKGIMHFKLTGNTPSEERFRLVDEFNKNENVKVFLISLKAGGTGLNLVGADTVIHYDPWWNFSAENQASDRVHRIGQKNNVQIIKMITKDSIEEKILDLQNKKKDLFNKVVSDDGNILTKLTNEELLSLFNITPNK